jgi:hypothetical protein
MFCLIDWRGAVIQRRGIATKARSTISPRINDLLPIDTAVAATKSEIVRVTVATSSSAAMRRLERALSALGGAKPRLPIGSVIVCFLGESVSVFSTSRRIPTPVRLDLGEAIDE